MCLVGNCQNSLNPQPGRHKVRALGLSCQARFRRVNLIFFVFLSALEVALYGWVKLAHELLCGSMLLVALFFGSVAQNGRFGGRKSGGFMGGLSGLGPFIVAPFALAVGLVIGALFPPWSTAELVAMVVASTFALILGYTSSSS